MAGPNHGSFEQRGLSAVTMDRNREGPFGRMFKHAKPYAPPRECSSRWRRLCRRFAFKWGS